MWRAQLRAVHLWHPEPKKTSVVRGKKLLLPSWSASQGQVGMAWSVLGGTPCGVLRGGISPL